MPQSRLLGSNLSYTYGKVLSNSSDILLADSEEFLYYSPDLSEVVTQSGLLQQAYPENREFLYLIQEFNSSESDRVLISSEMGIGKIQKTSDKYYLKREYAARYYDGVNYYISDGNSINFAETSFLVCSSFLPESYLDALVYSNSVLCSNEYNGPVGVDIPPSSILGRLNGNIQSLDKNELRLVLTDENIIDAIEQSSKNLTFLCQSLNLSANGARLSTPSIRVLPSYNNTNRPIAQRGTVIYNDQTNRLEVYNGADWKSIKWADEDSAGATGPTGATGATGPTGPTGATGVIV